ncbi:sulfite exporter TauE/SafE family protein [Lacinutrix neustonica]|uniref:Probable membrane transporter protein n=1 Tax=Lacinutrix neustonica TaxID=2980107 RepID=A0A9E8MXG0_9FLAO|nr:sulfite exporter TauE/SafE family protein [Lacinutrix neustonica]WAC02069.1 sulfite exporter TauE/SafE family protein [Lacinutrix neustonica]
MKTKMDLQMVFVLIIIGLLAGIFSGMFGIGGGVVMVPLMVFALGYSQHQAQGTSLAVLAVPVTFLAAYTYHKTGEHPINFKYALVIAACFVLGGYLGTKIAVSINETLLKKIFSVLLAAIAIKMFFSK